jgi:hypothetical protein
MTETGSTEIDVAGCRGYQVRARRVGGEEGEEQIGEEAAGVGEGEKEPLGGVGGLLEEW